MQRSILLAVIVSLGMLALGCQKQELPSTIALSTTPTLKTEMRMSHVLSKDGTKIAFEKGGSGPAVIVVNGALAHRNIYRDKHIALSNELSTNYTTYLFDRRGRGESSDTKPYSVEREIEDIEALIQEAGGKAYLFGSSSGAALALQTAGKLGPDKVTMLALYEPPYGQKQADYDKQKQGVNDLIKTGKPGDAAEFFMGAIGTPPEALEGMKSSPEWEAIKKIDFTLANDFEVLGNGAIPSDILKAIKVPTLVMDGEMGVPFIDAAADEIAKLIPGAQRKTLAGQTHQAEAKVVAPVLIEFFTRP